MSGVSDWPADKLAKADQLIASLRDKMPVEQREAYWAGYLAGFDSIAVSVVDAMRPYVPYMDSGEKLLDVQAEVIAASRQSFVDYIIPALMGKRL